MAGVMFRSSLSPDAPHASMLVSTVGKAKFRRRLTAGGITQSDGPATGSTSVPQWLKVSRRGNTFTAYLSDDGATWTLVHAPVTVEMPETIEVGLFASRVGGASLTTARLTDVQLVRD